jgi:hypothetical protein
VSVNTETCEQSFPAIRFACPKCGTEVRVVQSQGDLCPGCNFEFKWFLPHEAEPARDYHEVLTGEKYLLALPDGRGWIVAHG